MFGSSFEVIQTDDENPMDMIVELAESKNWKCTRHDDDLVVMTIAGQYGEYEICMEWQEEFAALLFACTLPFEIAENHYEMAARALEQINQNLWMGHFDLSNKGNMPTYRHTMLCRAMPANVTADIVYDVIDIALAECDRFYTTFQMVQAGDVSLQDNLHAAVFETIGEA